jgi:CrcB protein
MPNLLFVMIGGAVGAGLRYEAGRIALARFGSAFPWGTLIVNLSGGLLAGLLVGTVSRLQGGEQLLLLLGVGLLGGFTTFSAFSVEVAGMVERGQLGTAAGYAAGSVTAAIAAVFLGLWIARTVA